jgi:cohesin complex subunit SA-1/2
MIMGDEVQYRCAGYIQAETERHLEEIEGDAPRPDGGEGQGKTSDEDSDRDDVEGEKTPQQAKKGKAGKGAKQAAGNVNVGECFCVAGLV